MKGRERGRKGKEMRREKRQGERGEGVQ